jgi:hypothetical protein
MNRKKRGPMSMANAGCHRAKRILFCILAIGALQIRAASAQEKPAPTPAATPPPDTRLLQLKRLCVDEFPESILDKQVREMVIAQLFESKRFTLTEKCERADARIKGTVTQQRSQVSRSESEGVSAGREAAAASASGGSVSVGAVGGQLSAHESLSSSQMKEHAAVTIRLIDREGDIIWAITLESDGGKNKGAVGDAAERVVKRLIRDIERAEEAQKQEKPGQAQVSKPK